MKIIAKKVVEKEKLDNLITHDEIKHYIKCEFKVYMKVENNYLELYSPQSRCDNGQVVIAIFGNDVRTFEFTNGAKTNKSNVIDISELDEDMIIKTDFYIGRIDKIKIVDSSYRFDITYLSFYNTMCDDEETMTDKELIEQNAYVLEQID